MSSTFTLDAGVFLAAFTPREPSHAESRALLHALHARHAPIIEPTLLLPEVAAVIGRGVSGDADLGRRFAAALRRLPNLLLIPLDETLADVAAGIAAEHHLRGRCAVYAAVALRFGSTLVTLDAGQHRSTLRAVDTCAPTDALRRLT